MSKQQKRIEMVRIPVSKLKFDFGNPRKISKKKKEELLRSLETYGNFGVFVIDEHYNLIGGTQRATVIMEKDPTTEVDCKMLIGYTEAELRSINIRDNTHSGEWDLDLLADWTADLNLDLGLNLTNDKAADRKIEEMELIHYEKYDYVLIVCRDQLSYNSLVRALGIEDKKVLVGPRKRPTRGRAIWFDDMKVDFVPREEPDDIEEADDADEAEDADGGDEQ